MHFQLEQEVVHGGPVPLISGLSITDCERETDFVATFVSKLYFNLQVIK